MIDRCPRCRGPWVRNVGYTSCLNCGMVRNRASMDPAYAERLRAERGEDREPAGYSNGRDISKVRAAQQRYRDRQKLALSAGQEASLRHLSALRGAS